MQPDDRLTIRSAKGRVAKTVEGLPPEALERPASAIRRARYWTHERITAAITAWYDRYGDPPRSVEWGLATDDHPQRSTVICAYGSWNAAIEAAGFKPVPRRERRNCPHCGRSLSPDKGTES